DWLTWYRQQWPGRALLWPGWSGPIYDALEVLDEEQAEALRRSAPPGDGDRSPGSEAAGRGDQAEPVAADAPPVGRPRPDRRAERPEARQVTDGRQGIPRTAVHRRQPAEPANRSGGRRLPRDGDVPPAQGNSARPRTL